MSGFLCSYLGWSEGSNVEFNNLNAVMTTMCAVMKASTSCRLPPEDTPLSL